MSEIKHYLKSEDDSTLYDLEEDFTGLLYAKTEGMFAKGERTDYYEESFTESDELRVWQGDKNARKATTVTMTLYFAGKDRMTQYERFYNVIKQGKWYYWNTMKKKLCYFVLKSDFAPSEEKYVGSTPYFEVKVKMQNLWGECKDCDENGELI